MALLFGVHETTDITTPADTVQRVGGNATRVFTGGVITPRDLVKAATQVCQASWKAGLTAVWSFKPHPAGVADGTWRPHVEALGDFLKANPDKKTVVVIWHEPENDVPEWFKDATAFVRLFDTVAGWLRARHPGVVTCHAALGYRYADNKDVTDAYAPKWRTSADVHTIDAYSGRSFPIGQILPEMTGYRRWRKHVARDSRWGVTERGWTLGKGATAAQRVESMRREAEWLAGLPAADAPEFYLLWNTGGTENDRGLLFDGGADDVARTMTRHLAGRGSTPAAGNTGTAPVGGRVVMCPQCQHRFPA